MTTDVIPSAPAIAVPPPGAGGPAAPLRRRPGVGAVRRLARGRPDEPAWVRPALLALLGTTAVLYLWDLGASGWANSFYSAAVQAGSKSWKAFFFGSSDAANFITVDKPPASLWVMELSARVFGVSSWSILVPQALEGVAAVGVLYATVRRVARPGAALLAGLVLATTPVAALMFRFNNPDALLVLLLTAAAYATVRALERASTGWLVIAMAAVGTGFLTKMMQAFLVVPALGLVYLVAAPVHLRRRIAQLAMGAVALIVSSGWWVAIVQLTPASARPYVGGSQDNSILNLIFGYNGLGRLSGNESGSVGAGGALGSRWGPTGWTRFFGSEFGGQISWLLPAALILAAGSLWLWRRRDRTDPARAAMLLFAGWLVVTAVVISFAQGIIHPYYSVAVAPAVGAMVGIGAAALWERRGAWGPRIILAVGLATTAVWAYVLLDRTPHWLPAVRVVVLALGLGAAVVLVVRPHLRGRAALVVGAVGVCSALAGPTAYALDTVATPHQGAIPAAGPSTGAGPGAVPGGAGRPGAGGFGSGTGHRGTPLVPGAAANGAFGPPGGGRGAGAGGFPPPGGPGLRVPTATAGGAPGAAFSGRGGGANPGGGGFLSISTPGSGLVRTLEAGAARYTWVLATVNSNAAAGYQLATGDPVMAVGGFNGTDPAPTLAEFEADVAAKRVHYFIAGGSGPAGGGTGTTAAQITQWVESHFAATTVDGASLYDLSTPR